MSQLKANIRATLNPVWVDTFFSRRPYVWRVEVSGDLIATFVDFSDAVDYAHWLVSKLRRVRLTDVETDGDVVTYSYTANVRDLDELPQLMRAAELRSRLMLGASR